ncbi:MAG: hypothetical protein HQL58_02055 [Magnetococcales bacterium]|nr:hypothetical protein [Magnetococcales bacterium]
MTTPRYPAAPQYRRHPPRNNRRGRKLLGLGALAALLWWGFSGDSSRTAQQTTVKPNPAEQLVAAAPPIAPRSAVPTALPTTATTDGKGSRKNLSKPAALTTSPPDAPEPVVTTTPAPPMATPPVTTSPMTAAMVAPPAATAPASSMTYPQLHVEKKPGKADGESKPAQPVATAAPATEPNNSAKFQMVPWAPVEGFNAATAAADKQDKNAAAAAGEKSEKVDGKKRSNRKKAKAKPVEPKTDPDMPEVELTFYDQLKRKHVVVPEEKPNDKNKGKPVPAAAVAPASTAPASTAKPAPNQPHPVRMKDNSYFVPVNSYHDIRMATDKVSQWQRKGLPALVVPSQDGRTFQIGFGPFPNSERATTFLHNNNKWRQE